MQVLSFFFDCDIAKENRMRGRHRVALDPQGAAPTVSENRLQRH